MSRPTARARTGQDRPGLYQEITDKITAELEAGRVPWVQPWRTAAANAPLAMPKNASTERRYSGINVLILWGALIERGFAGQSWLTFRQALGLGGNVRKGGRGTTVVYADRFVPDDERKRAAETGEDAQAIPFLKRFTVFNTDQCDGLPEEVAKAASPPPPGMVEPEAERLIAATGADFRIGGARAFYSPLGDFVQVPPPQAYFEPINWHRTAFHELGHNAVARICRMAEAGADLTLASFEHFPLAQFWECSSPDGWRVRLERRADLLPVPEHSFCLLIVRIVDFNRQARKWAASSTLLD